MDLGKRIENIIKNRNAMGTLSLAVALGTAMGSYYCYNNTKLYLSASLFSISVISAISSYILFTKKI